MQEIIILKNCLQCNSNHIGSLDLRTILYAGASASTPKPKEISTLVSCPETKGDFKVTFSVVPDEGTEVLGVKSLVLELDHSGLTEKVLQHLADMARKDNPGPADTELPAGKIIVPPKGTVIAGFQIVAVIT